MYSPSGPEWPILSWTKLKEIWHWTGYCLNCLFLVRTGNFLFGWSKWSGQGGLHCVELIGRLVSTMNVLISLVPVNGHRKIVCHEICWQLLIFSYYLYERLFLSSVGTISIFCLSQAPVLQRHLACLTRWWRRSSILPYLHQEQVQVLGWRTALQNLLPRVAVPERKTKLVPACCLVR